MKKFISGNCLILSGRLSVLTGFCPVSCCYHKPCKIEDVGGK